MPNVRKRTTKPTPDPSTPLPSTPQRQQRKGESIRLIIGAFLILGAIYIVLTRSPSKTILPDGRKIWKRDQRLWSTEVEGHGDFEDGRRRLVNRDFVNPPSKALHWVNVILGNGGPEPNLSGGMIPAVAPPFGMTRWTPQTRQNYVSMCPYNQSDTIFHGFLGTHQPAVWMGLGHVETDFAKRGLPFNKEDEYASANYYRNVLNAKAGFIEAEMTASSRVGHLRFTFNSQDIPHVVVQASRESILLNATNTEDRKPNNITYPKGQVTIDRTTCEICGWNDERQDHILVGDDLPAKSFKGYFCARFSEPFVEAGISKHGKKQLVDQGQGEVLAGWVTFNSTVVEVRVGVSFLSVEQARRNIDLEIPNGQTLEQTSYHTRQMWSDKLDSVHLTGTPHNQTVFYTSFAHTLVYPYEIHESTPFGTVYYSGYIDKVVAGESYSGYSTWDTFRAATAWLLLTAPERVPGMINSMLQDYQQGGWLPMWKNLVETNIMVGTYSDSIIAQAIKAGVQGVDWDLAWEAVKKDAFTPPDRDTELRYGDRDEHTPIEARAGLTEYTKIGYVANDLHTESGSRTLDYAYDDWAASIVADYVGAKEAGHLLLRSKSYANLWHDGFMEARNADGSWAGPDAGWTEGDHWAYSLTVMHDVPGLIQLMGGNTSFINFMDRHFEEGHNLHSNEPSHHIPYLYSFAGAPHKTQEMVLTIAQNEYNHTAGGLSGNEDCGQMSAWYLFSAMGFYPVDPASATYVIGTPFFDSLELQPPGAARPITITAHGASRKKYIKSVTVDGEPVGIHITHDQLKNGADVVFEMADTPQRWGM